MLYCPVCGRAWTTVVTPTNPPPPPHPGETGTWGPPSSESLPILSPPTSSVVTMAVTMTTNADIYTVPAVAPSMVARQPTLSIGSSQDSVTVWKNAFSGEVRSQSIILLFIEFRFHRGFAYLFLPQDCPGHYFTFLACETVCPSPGG